MALSNKIIKVCKIDDLAFGKFAILNGVDYLGVHIIKEEDIGKHKNIIKALVSFGGRIIIVTKITRSDLLKKIIESYKPIGLQLHYKPNIELIKNIKKIYPDLEIFSVITDEIDNVLVKQVVELSDKLIYDSSYRGGTGKNNKMALLKKLTKNTKKKILIAGGINLDFIKNSQNLKVAGFDIQSYFRGDGFKYFNRLESIIRLIKMPRHSLLSISITDRDEIKSYTKEYNIHPHFSYHLDYSDGSLYDNFITDKKIIFKKVATMNSVPLNVHIFSKNKNEINRLMGEFNKINQNSISTYFIQYFPELDLNNINKNINWIISVYYKDLDDYLKKWPNFTNYLSLALPSSDKSCMRSVINFVNKNSWLFLGKEIWLDRELD